MGAGIQSPGKHRGFLQHRHRQGGPGKPAQSSISLGRTRRIPARRVEGPLTQRPAHQVSIGSAALALNQDGSHGDERFGQGESALGRVHEVGRVFNSMGYR